MPNPQQLKERIYALNPELKKLGFGCQVSYEGAVGNPHIWHVGMCLGVTAIGSAEVWTSFVQYFEPEKLRIIGKRIELSHVLRAIQESEFNCVYYPALTGKEMKINICANGKEVNYSLEKTFDQNIAENEELVTFLLSIIKE